MDVSEAREGTTYRVKGSVLMRSVTSKSRGLRMARLSITSAT